MQDLDVDMQLELSRHNYTMLMAQIRADAALLEKLHVMDYSLLLGVHYVNWGASSWHLPAIDSDVVRPLLPQSPLQSANVMGLSAMPEQHFSV